MGALNRTTLDCRRLLCPLPVIRVQEQVETMLAGEELEAVCTDRGALHDIPAWCRINGHAVLEMRSTGVEHVVVLRVGGA